MFEQVKLPYDFSALEPHIDTATMEVHYTGHHATYTKNLNDLAEKVPSLANKPILQILCNLGDVPEEHQIAVRNNGGGFYAHNLYFSSLSPNGAKAPSNALKSQIDNDFSNFSKLQEALSTAAMGQFGSGYAWLVYSHEEKKLSVKKTANQDIPMTNEDTTPLLLIDVWEHAYYLKHKNKRADHVSAIFNVIDWDVVSERYKNKERLS